MANPSLPAWLTGTLVPLGAVLGAFAKSLLEKWRHRRTDRAQAAVGMATAADTLVGTAMGLLDQVQTELEAIRLQLGQCREERRMQEDVIVGLRQLVERLTQERDSLRELLEQAARPH
jgi:hypothetical protein